MKVLLTLVGASLQLSGNALTRAIWLIKNTNTYLQYATRGESQEGNSIATKNNCKSFVTTFLQIAIKVRRRNPLPPFPSSPHKQDDTTEKTNLNDRHDSPRNPIRRLLRKWDHIETQRERESLAAKIQQRRDLRRLRFIALDSSPSAYSTYHHCSFSEEKWRREG